MPTADHREFEKFGRDVLSTGPGGPGPGGPAGQVALARQLAVRAHAGQTDKAGVAYIGHPAAVAAAFDAESDWVEHCAAWLHDVVEDTDLTADDLRAAGVAEAVVRVVVLLTRTPEVPDEEYYRRIRDDPRARRVKLADIAHNTDPERRAALPAETRERLAAKYAKALAALA